MLGKFTYQLIDNLMHKQIWTHAMPFIIIAEAIIMVPMCKVLNFQKFQILTIPILVTIAIIFLCLIFNLVYRIKLGLNNDFCTILEGNEEIPSAEYGFTYANVIPSLCFAFGFHIYVLQVHKTVDRPDPNGYGGMKIGLWTLSIMFMMYGLLLGITTAYQEPHNKNHIIYVYDIVFNAGTVFELVTQISVIIQLLCHTPFVFYIAQEHVLVFIDELTRKSTSRMLDEYKQVNGKGLSKRFVTKELEDSENKVYTVTRYRLPCMTMPKK
jgi:hypothetical protein